MELSLDLPDDTAEAFFTELSDNNFAEIAVRELEDTHNDFAKEFPEIQMDFDACISKMNYLAEIDEHIISEIAARIKTGMNGAQKAWSALSSLETNDPNEGIVLTRDHALNNLRKLSESETKNSFKEYKIQLLDSLTGVLVTSASRSNTGGVYTMNSRRAKAFARNQLDIISGFADLLQISLVTLHNLTDEDEAFLIEDVETVMDSKMEDLSQQRQQNRSLNELADFAADWVSLFKDIHQDFDYCISMLSQLEDTQLFDELQSELYSSMLQAEEAWDSIMLIQVADQDISPEGQIIFGANGSLKEFGQGLITEIQQHYQLAEIEVPPEVQQSAEDHLNSLLRCSVLIADTRYRLACQADEHQIEE